MTVAELIAKLSDYDPSSVVCYSDKRVAELWPVPIADEVWPDVEIVSGGEKYMCVVLTPDWWPR